MRKRFCPKCGETITQGTFCDNCIENKIDYETILIQVSEFNRVIEEGRWRIFEDLDDIIKKRINKALGERNLDVEIEPYEFIPQPKEKILIYVNVIKDGVDLRLPVKISYMQCDFGQKEKTGYFEGILQLRNPSDEVHEFIKNDLKKVAKKGVFISKTVPAKNGVDLYFTKKGHMRLLAHKLNNSFGGIIKINSQLFSHNHETSRDIYRVNIYVELPDFNRGDVISFIATGARNQDKNRQYALVTSLGKLMQARNLFTGKSMAFELKYTKDLEKETIQKTKIVAINSDLQVLNPETYQTESISNKNILNKEYSLEDEVNVVFSDKGVVIVESK